MAYSIDLRKRVVDYIENGGSIKQASVLFQVGSATIYRWLRRQDLTPSKNPTAKIGFGSAGKRCLRKSVS